MSPETLECVSSARAPLYSSGQLRSYDFQEMYVITLKGGIAVYEEEAPSDCKVLFKFQKNRVLVSHPNTHCNFLGYNVNANGVYKLKNRKKPKFEIPDYIP